MKDICLERIFPHINSYNQLQIDDAAVTIITPPHSARYITNIIYNHIKSFDILDPVIVDSTACVGCDTISFANKFHKVYAIEINEERIRYLTNNINAYMIKNVTIIQGDCLDFLYNPDKLTDLNQKSLSRIASGDHENQDQRSLPKITSGDHGSQIHAIYIDPPWGEDYKTDNSLRFKLSNQYIETVVMRILENNQILLIGIKISKNYNMMYFKEMLKRYSDYELLTYDQLKKINLLIIKKINKSTTV